MAEFVAGLIVITTMIAGLIQISVLSKVNVENLMEARGEADDNANSAGAFASSGDYIRDWRVGSDGLRYTADDTPTNGIDSVDVYNQELQDPLPLTDTLTNLGLEENDEFAAPLATNSIVDAATLRKGESRAEVPVENALKKLVIGDTDTITIEDSVYMPNLSLLGGD